MSIKRYIFESLPLWLKVYLYKKTRLNYPCGYGETLSTYIQQAFNTFLTTEELHNASLKNKLTNDIIGCWLKYKALPYEYFLFDFRNTPQKCQRAKFLTDWDRLPKLSQMPGSKEFVHDINNKYNFYCKMKSFFKREAMLVDKATSKEEFIQFALRVKVIFAKLIAGSKGFGAISRNITTTKEAEALFKELLTKGDSWIVEERIQQSAITSQWCTTCVNTIRIPSFLTSKGFYILDPFFRTGHEGSIVDNAGQGGVFAVIDPKTGTLITDGVDEAGKYYKQHPDSHLPFKGWQIPFWKELVETAEKAHRMLHNQKYIGWDFALTKENEWVLIEANWGQMVGQYATKKGIKEEFYNYLYL